LPGAKVLAVVWCPGRQWAWRLGWIEDGTSYVAMGCSSVTPGPSPASRDCKVIGKPLRDGIMNLVVPCSSAAVRVDLRDCAACRRLHSRASTRSRRPRIALLGSCKISDAGADFETPSVGVEVGCAKLFTGEGEWVFC
jgi:hypothetical protein